MTAMKNKDRLAGSRVQYYFQYVSLCVCAHVCYFSTATVIKHHHQGSLEKKVLHLTFGWFRAHDGGVKEQLRVHILFHSHEAEKEIRDSNGIC